MRDKFTPGPWAYATDERGWCYHIHQADNADFNHENACDVAFMTVQCDPKSVQEANAQLIAAAPDLLAALRGCLAFIERDMPTLASSGPERLAALEAIQKATGVQP